MKNILNLIGFQLGWWMCVLGVKNELIYLGPFIMLIFLVLHIQYISKQKNTEIVLVLISILLGLIIDGYLKFNNIIIYNGDINNKFITPIWILAMWAGFATTINHSLNWLSKKIVSQLILGCIFGPLSYIAGQKMGILIFSSTFNVTLILSILWGFSIPILFAINSKLNNYNYKNIIISLITIIIAFLISIIGSINFSTFNQLPVLSIFVIISFFIHWIIFIPSFIYKSEKLYDITGTIAYLTIILTSIIIVTEFGTKTIFLRSIIILCLLTLWSTRLGLFLLFRVLNAGEDKRFRDVKNSGSKFFVWFTISALWVFLTTCNAFTLVLNNSPITNDIFFISGLVFWIIGFAIEILADDQKRRFKLNPNNKNKFISTGLWKFCRHPNYFGEIIQWFSIALISLPTLIGWQFISLISPFFVTILLIKVSGINLLENSSDLKWGTIQSYIDYKNNTPILIPFIGKK